MQSNHRWGYWTTLMGMGVGLGWAVHCQTPPSHVKVGMGEDCAMCHQSEFQNASQPLHVGVISTDCADCHGNSAWSPARGSNHSWPLDGAHSATACNACHTGEPAVYDGTPSACLDCHREQRDQVTEPSHADFSDDCQSCHGTGAWQPATLEHEWPLLGAHATATCTSCHTGDPPVYDGTPEACIGCHQDDRNGVTQPSHDGFAEDCSTCHTSDAWRPANFPMHEWPLEGVHATTTCAGCHTGDPPVYDGTPEACIGCHQDDRNSVTQPSHDGFAEDCSTCHTSAAWRPADFPAHEWPLDGAHATTTCASCHTGNPPVYDGTVTECVGCHQEDYDTSQFPGHSDFATTCQDCHTTVAWRPASGGNHPENLFSITGDHNYACNECHNPSLGPNGAGNADCVGCHEGEHTLARMDAEHNGEGDYPLGPNRAPNFCLACHADGRE